VEVISESETEREAAEKVTLWLEAGAERVWEVRERTRTVTVHTPGHPPRTLRDGDALHSDDASFSVEGFSLPVSDIFD
jgi:Uma2 family endonuclease